MRNTILRLPEVIDRTGLSRGTIYNQISDGNFPEPVSLGARAVGWIEADIDEWVQSKIEMGWSKWRGPRGQAWEETS